MRSDYEPALLYIRVRGRIDIVSVAVCAASIGSPEIYFGSARNEHLGNGFDGKRGPQTLTAPSRMNENSLYLDGTWTFDPEFARNDSADAKILFKFTAKNVYMVLGSAEPSEVEAKLDGQTVDADSSGIDLTDGTMTIEEERLYHLISLDDYGQHILEIIVKQPGLEALTFTFG